MHVLIFFLKWGSVGYSLGIVQWNFTRRDHPGNPRWGIRVGSCHARPSVAAASPTPAAVQSPAGDAEGSSSMAPAHRRYIPGLGPLHPLLRIPGQPGLQAQGSHPLRDPGRHPLHLIGVFPEPQTYLQHPSSGGLTSLATPSRGILAAKGVISMERFTRSFGIFRRPGAPRLHAPRAAIPSIAIHGAASVLLSSGSHRVISFDDI